MRKTARIIYVFIGCIFPILIGLLHTITHFGQLTTSNIQKLLDDPIVINGQEQTLWNTWGIMSFMMGIAFIIIGLLNVSTFLRLLKEEFPPISVLTIMIMYLIAVIYAGYQFEQIPQFIGGIIGFILTIFCIVISYQKEFLDND